eukprot:1147151-Pelagomonas_calceolata.AAC.4
MMNACCLTNVTHAISPSRPAYQALHIPAGLMLALLEFLCTLSTRPFPRRLSLLAGTLHLSTWPTVINGKPRCCIRQVACLFNKTSVSCFDFFFFFFFYLIAYLPVVIYALSPCQQLA